MTAAVFFFLLAIGVPIFAVLALSTVAYIWLTGDTALFDNFLVQIYGGLGNFGLMAIPLFIITGELMNECGITSRLVALSRLIVGSVRGGLAYVNIVANGLMAAIVGSAIAQTAVMTRVMVPEMERAGYPRADAAAMTCAGGLLGPIIPPSMPFIIFAVLSQVPVADMLVAGMLPGLLLALGFILVAGIVGFKKNYPKSDPIRRGEAMRIVVGSIPALLVPLAIVGTIISGLGSPTEAAAAAAIAAMIVGRVAYRELDLTHIPAILERAGKNAAMVLIIVAASAVFGWVIVYNQVPGVISDFLIGFATDPYTFLLLVAAGLLIVGMFIDGIAALIITVPILLPAAEDIYGIDPVQFGVVAVLTLVIGLLTPPVGAALYVSAGIAQVSPFKLFRSTFPYIVVALLTVVVLCFVPYLSLALIR